MDGPSLYENKQLTDGLKYLPADIHSWSHSFLCGNWAQLYGGTV